MVKTIDLDNLKSKTDNEQSSDDELEIKPPKPAAPSLAGMQPEKEKIYKQRKERKQYEYTEAVALPGFKE